MTQIQVISIKRNLTSYDFTYKMWFVLPAIYGTGAAPIKGLSSIVESYPDGFDTEVIPPDGTLITYMETVGLLLNVTLAQIKSQLQSKYATIRTKLDSLTLSPADSIIGLSYDGTNWV